MNFMIKYNNDHKMLAVYKQDTVYYWTNSIVAIVIMSSSSYYNQL